MNSDPYHLKRFLDAQTTTYDRALAELKAGQKRSHWIWYIFPQYRGLGFSAMSQKYAIQSLDEAKASDRSPRVRLECTTAVLGMGDRCFPQKSVDNSNKNAIN
jgi:uncharacterized protein (DUF1810 family)